MRDQKKEITFKIAQALIGYFLVVRGRRHKSFFEVKDVIEKETSEQK